jgi:Fe(3+) dicitrate transport protein
MTAKQPTHSLLLRLRPDRILVPALACTGLLLSPLRGQVLTPQSVDQLDELRVAERTVLPGGIGSLPEVMDTRVFSGRKTELVSPELLNANRALNQSRQLFAKIPGANLWENDGTGIQLGVGTRGLNPNRLWEFNVRQEGYDISSDVFGYPEAYYTPPMEVVERIEFVRGAAGLQFGPQFGGLMDFRIKHGATDKAVAVETRQTIGTYGTFNTFNSVGGSQGAARYYGAFQYRTADGWREFGNYDQYFGLGRLSWKLSDTVSLHGDFAWFDYEQRQPAGLTDAQFAADPSQARRQRNWFAVEWWVPALRLEWAPREGTLLSTQLFAVIGERYSVGILTGPNVADPGNTARTVLLDDYYNYGLETRLRHDWSWLEEKHTLATGFRLYEGNTERAQGAGSTGRDADFTFTAPGNLENDFDFVTTNAAAFVENLFRFGDFSLTPGLRFEQIETEADGSFRIGAGPARGRQDETYERTLPLFGLSAAYRAHPAVELYGSASQAYRPLHFNDVRVTNPVQATDPDAQDSEGWVVEAGVRGSHGGWFRYDLSAFELFYGDRFGTRAITAAERSALGVPASVTTLRTNIADARSRGIESYVELDVLRAFDPNSEFGLAFFNSTSLTEAEYVEGALKGRRLELAPRAIYRSGVTVQGWSTALTLQHSHTTRQFSDAENTVRPNAAGTVGLVPSYTVWDVAVRHDFLSRYSLELSINNLFDEAYFTRRAGGYPGPGIVPADGRTATLTFGAKF